MKDLSTWVCFLFPLKLQKVYTVVSRTFHFVTVPKGANVMYHKLLEVIIKVVLVNKNIHNTSTTYITRPYGDCPLFVTYFEVPVRVNEKILRF